VTLLRLGSTTHTFDADQRFLRLTSSGTGQERVVTVPANPAECPPGHYMLFALSADGDPSTGHIDRVGVVTPTDAPTEDRRERSPAGRRAPRAEGVGTGTVVTIGLTAQCPYGLGPCWGGAYSALSHLEDVVHVDPVPNQTDQTAQVSLAHRGLPDLSR
jgi:galactose oxidase